MAGQLRLTRQFTEPLSNGYSSIRITVKFNEPLTAGVPNLRSDRMMSEPLSGGMPNLRFDLMLSEPLTGGYRNLRSSLMIVEVLQPVEPEAYMSTALFPGSQGSGGNRITGVGLTLPGLAFSVHKKPYFSTRIASGQGGQEARNALMQYPRWDFELTYEFLEDRSGANSSLKSIIGFYLQRQGSFDSFLFKDPDDYLVTNGTIATADGVTVQFPFVRNMGGFIEKVGQVDNVSPLTIYGTVAQSTTIPATPGPYTVTVTNSASFIQDLGVTKAGVAMTAVVSAPTTGQYSVAAGVYTFAAADQTAAIIITYRYTIAPAAYTVTMPNLLVFTTAPANGTILSGDYQFYFACRFNDDQMDFEKFADQLWALQSCNFKSLIQ